MRVCFYARVPSREILDTVNFYSQDLRALRELGHEVVIATRLREIPPNCDLYYAWWWSWAFVPYARARLARKPLIVTGVFDYDTAAGAGASYLGRPWHKRLVLRSMLALADANVFLSRYELDLIRRRFRPRNAFCVPCSVDVERYRSGTTPRGRFLLNVAWSGAVNGRRKCLPEILEAFPAIRSRHPDIRLVLAGRPGELHPTLVATAHRLQVADAIDFLGVIDEPAKIALMQTCAAYLQPTRGEGFGLAIAEAMACGAPVVTNGVGAVPEVVGPGARLLADPTPPAIAEATIQLLDNPAEAVALGARARQQIVANFAYPARRDGLAKVIASVLPATR
jgi:glycosyltransferase involved in cell wall biosynthesis